jgi:hypothetical protein
MSHALLTFFAVLLTFFSSDVTPWSIFSLPKKFKFCRALRDMDDEVNQATFKLQR